MDDFGKLCPGCDACKGACPFLAEFGTPDRILGERPEAAFYCTSCRRCDRACPRGLSPSAAFFAAKQRLVRRDAIPAPVRKTLEGARRFARAGRRFPFALYKGENTVFWPGCGLAANRSGLVRRVRDILAGRLSKPVGLVLDCCFDPVYGLGDTETALGALNKIDARFRRNGIRKVITGCLNCHRLLSEHLEAECIFVLEALPPEMFEKQGVGAIGLHHPCPALHWDAIRQRAEDVTRGVIGSPGGVLPPTPIPDNPVSGAATAGTCCGNGGGLNALHPVLAERFLDRITGEAASRRIATYCIGCQNRFLRDGAEAIHLLECLPGVRPRRTIPSPLAQWVNRFSLAMLERLATGK